MSYPGGKGNSYQIIINQLPPHTTFISAFLGKCAVLRHKRPAELTIGIDIDQEVIDSWTAEDVAQLGMKRFKLVCCDAIEFLKGYRWRGGELAYLDPPYVRSTRKQKGPLYKHEYSDEQHYELIQTAFDISSYGVNIAIHGYHSELYSKAFAHWRHITYSAITRGGSVATEYLWMNYEEPLELHDYQYLGSNFTDRQRIKRKIARWKNRLSTMPARERHAIFAAIQQVQQHFKK